MIVDSFRLMTGSTRRLGAAIAVALAEARANVCGTWEIQQRGRDVLASGERGRKTFFMPGDIADAGFC